jgi:hypothetical protein
VSQLFVFNKLSESGRQKIAGAFRTAYEVVWSMCREEVIPVVVHLERRVVTLFLLLRWLAARLLYRYWS